MKQCIQFVVFLAGGALVVFGMYAMVDVGASLIVWLVPVVWRAASTLLRSPEFYRSLADAGRVMLALAIPIVGMKALMETVKWAFRESESN